jgi:hypothetical protein
LLELLVVISVIGVLAGMILPALSKAKQRGLQIRCMSNLKQVGIAMQLFVTDNSDNLPGPLKSTARPSYDNTSSQELIWYLADYLDSQDPTSVPVEKPVIAEIFVCPAYQRYAPEPGPMIGRKCYLLNDNIPTGAQHVAPFGYPEQPATDTSPLIPLVPPMKLTQLENLASLADTYALTDLDHLNAPDIQDPIVWKLTPPKPVHGEVRNELYFDWHVSAKRLDW